MTRHRLRVRVSEERELPQWIPQWCQSQKDAQTTIWSQFNATTVDTVGENSAQRAKHRTVLLQRQIEWPCEVQ